jgi:hypothetical protein
MTKYILLLLVAAASTNTVVNFVNASSSSSSRIASAPEDEILNTHKESYFGKIDRKPEDAVRYYPPRSQPKSNTIEYTVQDDVTNPLDNETLSSIVTRLQNKMLKSTTSETTSTFTESRSEANGDIDYGNHNTQWSQGPSSWEEFGHTNDPSVCKLQTITVDEWERGKYWRGNVPVMVMNVTTNWDANVHWELDEMLRRYPDAEATMGDGRRVGEIGPDAAGRLLSPTTVKVTSEVLFSWEAPPPPRPCFSPFCPTNG